MLHRGGLSVLLRGLALLAASSLAMTPTTCERGSPPRPARLRPNVVLVVSDTLRRDHVGAYGYVPDVSPRIDEFGRGATIFARAYAQSPSTKPSMASIFTSLHPHRHGAIYNEDALAQVHVTIAEVFRDAGYETAGFTENPMLASDFGFDQGFGLYHVDSRRHGARPGSTDGFDSLVSRWIGRNRHREFFLYLHFIDPHSPYRAPPPYRGRFSETRGSRGEDLRGASIDADDVKEAIARYDEEILYVDDRFGRLLDRLAELDLQDETIVVFVSDHGEGFGEHGSFDHSSSVYAELIDVPLVISAPKELAPGNRGEPVQHIDLFPTLLDLAGLSSEGLALEGRTLVDGSSEELRTGSIMSEHLREEWGTRQRSVVSGDWKLVAHLDSGTMEIFDLSTDSADLTNRWHEVPAELQEELQAAMRDLCSEGPASRAPQVQIDAETRSALELLGYITGPEESPSQRRDSAADLDEADEDAVRALGDMEE
jgi:arylsulfatase A-like enzyme